MNIGQIPAKWARQTPDREAIIDSTTGQRVTFAAFDEHIRRLANGLVGLGLDKGDRVGILSQNSVEYAALYFACGRSGLVAQPMNWRLSAPELAKIVNNGEPRAYITQGMYAAESAELSGLVSSVEHWLQYGEGGDGSYEELVASSSDAEPEASAEVGDSDPLFILYTGGTTGESKGALHSHRSVYFGMLNQTVAERIVPSDVYMLTGQMFHIPVVLAMNYLAHGCPLVLMNFDATLAMELIQEEKVSAFLGVTTMLNWMMAVEGSTTTTSPACATSNTAAVPCLPGSSPRPWTSSPAPSFRATARLRAPPCASCRRKTTSGPSATTTARSACGRAAERGS